jgi:SAM-dependent methyltransferase
VTGKQSALPAIFAISFGLLIFEIMLSAIFHVQLGAGNTVAAIALALVGLSGGGIAAYSLPAFRDAERFGALAGPLLFWFSVSLLGGVYVIMAIPLGHGDLIYQAGSARIQLWRLLIYHVTVVPFFLGGLTLAAFFTREPERIGRLYFADLLGAALGCIVSPFLLAGLGAPFAVIAGALPAVALGVTSLLRAGGRRAALTAIPAALSMLGLVRPELLSFSTLNTMGEVEAPQYRSFPIGAGDISYERWALDAWTIIRGDHIPQQWEKFRGWGLSPRYDGPIPDTTLINYNARFSTYVTDRSGDPEALRAWLDADLSSVHHLIGRSYQSVLNIGAGGGREALAALEHGAERVVAVDISEVVVEDLMKDHLLEWSGGLYQDPRVEAVADEGRNFTERSSEHFDLVEFSIVGGANTEKMDLMRLDDLFTAEAIGTYIERLNEDGVFSYVMYSTRSDLVQDIWEGTDDELNPYVPALRTLTGLRLALEADRPGTRFADHVLIAALPGMISPRYDLVHIVGSRTPFSADERAKFLETCERLAFVPLHPVGGEAPGGNLYSRIAAVPELGALAEEAPFSIWPATDDRPFQLAVDTAHLGRAFSEGRLFELLADNPLVTLGVSIGGLAVALALAPLLLSARRRENLEVFRANRRMLLYFACIGFAYMAVEISALLRLQFFLGQPIYGLSVGLFSFLLASGLGSNFTNRIPDERLRASVTKIVLALVAMGLVYSAGSTPLFASAIALSLGARIAIAVLAIFPLAFLMGMLFPIGIRLMARDSRDPIAWAWATNGCFSVLGIFSTRILALFFGFNRVLIVGLGVYLLVLACVRLSRAK